MSSKTRALALGLGIALMLGSLAGCAGSSSPSSSAGGGGAGATLRVGWPAEWATKVPAPDGCTAGGQGLVSSTATYLNINCVFPDADPANHQTVLKNYKAKLVAAGWTLVVESSDGAETPDGVGMFQVRKDDLKVTITAAGAAIFTITVMIW